MKFVYVDESGNTADDPYLVFFGLQVDAYKLKKAMRDARPILEEVRHAFPEDLRELKASRMLNGVGGWRHVDPELRKRLFHRLCHLVDEIAAEAYIYVIDRAAYTAQIGPLRPAWASTPWLTGAITMAMFVQRRNQQAEKNKGLTILIFDDNKMELASLCEFLVRSCRHVDEYYERSMRADPFDHIIDTAFAIRSEHSRLVQVSDACAYAVRRRAEIEIGDSEELWAGEHEFILGACDGFKERVAFPTKTWAGPARCNAVDWIRRVGVPNLQSWMRA